MDSPVCGFSICVSYTMINQRYKVSIQTKGKTTELKQVALQKLINSTFFLPLFAFQKVQQEEWPYSL